MINLAGRQVTGDRVMRRRRRGIVRSAALRRSAFSWLNDISIGFKSGEYFGGWREAGARASIAARTPATLCAGRLSMATIFLRLSVGADHLDVTSFFRSLRRRWFVTLACHAGAAPPPR